MVLLLQLFMLMEMLDAQEFLIFFTSVVEFACLPDELAMIRSLNVKAVGPNGIHVESSKVCWRAI